MDWRRLEYIVASNMAHAATLWVRFGLDLSLVLSDTKLVNMVTRVYFGHMSLSNRV